MQFHDEIAPIGEVNEIGYELRKNVDRSVRRGAEGDFTWRVAPRLTVVATASVTDARIADYQDDATGESFHNTTSLLTPKFVSGHGIRSELASWLSLDVDGRYTSRMMTHQHQRRTIRGARQLVRRRERHGAPRAAVGAACRCAICSTSGCTPAAIPTPRSAAAIPTRSSRTTTRSRRATSP